MPTPSTRTISALRALLLTAAAVLAGCAQSRPAPTRDAEPGARVLAIHLDSAEARSAEVRVEIAFENPGAAVRVTSADYQALLDERVFGAGEVRLEQTIAARASVQLLLPIQLSFLELPAPVRERLSRGEPVELVVRGALNLITVGAEPTPLRSAEFDGETEVSSWEGADEN